MPDNETPAPPAPPATPEAPVSESPKPELLKATPSPPELFGEGGEKALKAERARANEATKTVKDLEAKVKEFTDQAAAEKKKVTDREKSEGEKFAERLAAAEKTATDASGRLVRYEVAVQNQVPAHLIEFVTGTTTEDVTASVAKVLAAFAASKPTGPKVDPSQGAGGQPVGLNEQITAAVASGDIRTAIRLKSALTLKNNPS